VIEGGEEEEHLKEKSNLKNRKTCKYERKWRKKKRNK
jgi:hypothetical protein